MHPSATMVLLASLASAGVIPPRDTASSTFKLESRLPNGTSMGYFTPTVGGGAWFGALVDDISDAKSLLLTDSSSEKASLIVPEDDSDDLNIYWNIGWLIGQYDSGQIEWVSLQREQDVEAWSTGFSIDGDEENLLKYNVPMIFGACRDIGLYRGSGPQTALYWRLPGSKPGYKIPGFEPAVCADFALHAIFD